MIKQDLSLPPYNTPIQLFQSDGIPVGDPIQLVEINGGPYCKTMDLDGNYRHAPSRMFTRNRRTTKGGFYMVEEGRTRANNAGPWTWKHDNTGA